MLLNLIYLAQKGCPWRLWASVGQSMCPPCRDRAGDLQFLAGAGLVPSQLCARKAWFHTEFKIWCCRWGLRGHRCFQGECKAAPGSRSLIRHLPFLQQNLPLNPDGVWLNPCSVKLCTAFKSPLLVKHTLQLQDPRYPCFHWVPPLAQLSSSGKLFPPSAPGFAPIQQQDGQALPQNWDLGLQPVWVRHHHQLGTRWNATPKPCRREGKSPRKVLAPWEKPEGCLGMRQEPSECQLQALGMSVTQEQLRRTPNVMFTSSKCTWGQEHFLQHKQIKHTL